VKIPKLVAGHSWVEKDPPTNTKKRNDKDSQSKGFGH
jgi:hypothetical protein